MHLVNYRSRQGSNLVLFVGEGPKYIKLLTMASTPRIIKVPREEARNMKTVPVDDRNNVPRFLEFTRKQHRGSTLSEEVNNILYKGEDTADADESRLAERDLEEEFNNILYKGEECELFTTED